MSNQSPVEQLKEETNKNQDGPIELTKGYEIDFEDEAKYHVKIGLSKLKKLKLTVVEISKYNNIYEAKFDHEELIAIDKFFGLYDTIEDVVKEIDNLFTKNCISISLDMNHSVVMEIQISINNKPRLIRLKLPKRGNEQTEALNNLCQLVTQQTKKLDSLQKENAVLKEKVGKLNKKLDSLKNNPGAVVGTGVGVKGMNSTKRKSGTAKKSEDESFGAGGPQKEDKGSLFKKTKAKENLRYGENSSKSDKKNGSKNEDGKEDQLSFEDEKEEGEKVKGDGSFNIEEIKSISKIILDIKDVTFLIQKMNNVFEEQNKEFYNMNLIYSASQDGDACSIFHSICDGICPILAMIKTKKGKRFGGFTTVPFECSNTFKGKLDDRAFIFSIDKKKVYEVQKGQNAICCYKNYGPVFYGYEYCNIYLIGNLLANEGNVGKKGDRFQTTEDFEINGGTKKFMATEIEVYQIILKDIENEDD